RQSVVVMPRASSRLSWYLRTGWSSAKGGSGKLREGPPGAPRQSGQDDTRGLAQAFPVGEIQQVAVVAEPEQARKHAGGERLAIVVEAGRPVVVGLARIRDPVLGRR